MIDEQQSKQFAADLLSGARTRVADGIVQGAVSGVGQRGAANADAMLDATRGALDAFVAARASNPLHALAMWKAHLGTDELTDADLDSFLDVWRTAVDAPAEFAQHVESRTRGRVGAWWDTLHEFVYRLEAPTAEEAAQLEGLRARYKFPTNPLAPPVNPHERRFEEADPSWVPLLKAKLGEDHWPEFLVDMRRHDDTHPWIYDVPVTNSAPITVGMVSDFGTGYYHSWAIAEQLGKWAYPYTFHLGDVYYAGRPAEFRDRFELPLFDVVDNTTFFGLAENHELYGGGGPFYDYFDKLRGRGRTPQEGSYWCVRFPHHQIIGIDANWQGRRRYEDEGLREWLKGVLATAGGRTNILCSGNAPFDHGDDGPRPLMTDLQSYLDDGQIGLWFWGDDHYCALYDRTSDVPFYGTCIGHGGYPGGRETVAKETYKTRPLWLETEPRFPEHDNLRPDMGNNGWCQMTLRPDGGVDLLYVDWLSVKRMAVSFAKAPTGKGLQVQLPLQRFDDRDVNPVFHLPPAR